MKCAEVRNLLRLYLDSELDAKDSLEVQQHLETCPECAGLFDAERKFDERLVALVRTGSRTAALWNAIEARIETKRLPHVALPVRWLAAAAAVLLILTLGFVWKSNTAPPLAAAASECHDSYLHRANTHGFSGPVPVEVAQEIKGRLNLEAFSYRPASADFIGQRKRFCFLANVPTAVTVGQYDSAPASIFVFSKSDLARFPAEQKKLESGERVVCGRAGRYQCATRIVGEYVICVVAETSRSRVEELARSIEDGA